MVMPHTLSRWLAEEDGQDLVEYVLLGAAVAFAGLLVMNNFDDVIHPFDEAGIVATPADVADIAQLGYSYAVPGTSGQPPTSPRLEGVSPSAQLWCRIGTLPAVHAA